MQNAAFGVPGIDQQGGARLKKRLQRLPGVQDVTVWLSEQQIDVYYDPDVTSPDTLVDTMRQLDYMAERIPWSKRTPG